MALILSVIGWVPLKEHLRALDFCNGQNPFLRGAHGRGSRRWHALRHLSALRRSGLLCGFLLACFGGAALNTWGGISPDVDCCRQSLAVRRLPVAIPTSPASGAAPPCSSSSDAQHLWFRRRCPPRPDRYHHCGDHPRQRPSGRTIVFPGVIFSLLQTVSIYEIHDERFKQMIVPSADLDELYSGCRWAEGPVCGSVTRTAFCGSELFWPQRILRCQAVFPYSASHPISNGHTRDSEGRPSPAKAWRSPRHPH